MHLTAFTDLSLRVLMRLAGNPERAFSTQELAAELVVSRHHLTKVVAQLSRAGFVATRRGNRGGLRLARDPADIRIGDVVAMMETGTALVECFRADGGNCTLSDRCQLPGRLAAARKRFIEDLNASSLADIAYRIEPADRPAAPPG